MSGRNAQVRISFETSEGVPGHDFTFLPFTTESLEMEYTPKPDPNIDPSGNEGETEILEAHGTGDISGAFNTESLVKLRAHMHEYYEIENVTTGVEKMTLRDLDEVNDTPVSFYTGSLNAGIWRDERDNPTEFSALGLKASQMELTVGKFDWAVMKHSFLFTRDSYARKPFEQAVNAAWTGDIHVRGFVRETDYRKFKVPAGGGGVLGVAKFVWGEGAAAYGTTEYLTAAVMDVMNDDDTLAGTRQVPYQILIDAPAGHVFTAGDEWRIYPFALKAVASFSTRPKLTGTAALLEFTLDGSTKSYRISEFSLRHGVPREAKGGIGSIYDQEIGLPAESKRWWEFEFSRNYVDLELKHALALSIPISVYVKLFGKKIGSTAHEDYAEWTLPNMKITSGAGITTQSAGDQDESPVLRSFGPNPCTEVYQNTISSITPT